MARRLLPLARPEHLRLEIVRPLEDVIVAPGDNASFTSKTLGYPRAIATWFKDGNLIIASERISIFSQRNNYRLEISNVVADDHGLYTVVFRNINDNIMSKARLFVIPMEPHMCAIYTEPIPRRAMQYKLSQPLMVIAEREFFVELRFRVKCTSFLWFRNNQPVNRHTRYFIRNTATSTSLAIPIAQLGDSGLYIVLVRTLHGYMSVIFDVYVVNRYPQNWHRPQILDPLPEEKTFFVGDEMLLTVRAIYDSSTTIEWVKDGRILRHHFLDVECYGDDYFGLRIPEVNALHSAEYTVNIRNVCLHNVTTLSTTCSVTIIDAPPAERLLDIMTVLPLKSVLTSVGAKIVFHCQFILPKYPYYYVVWSVNRHVVESTNEKFEVICKGGNFILYIPCVEVSMCGLVVCELRKYVPHATSAKVAESCAHIAIMPETYLTKLRVQRSNNNSRIRCAFSAYPREEDPREVAARYRAVCARVPEVTIGNPVMEIIYVRFKDGFYYLHAVLNEEPILTPLEVHERPTGVENTYNVSIAWNYAVFPALGTFRIELADSMDSFTTLGLISIPRVDIEDLPVSTLVRVRIRCVGRLQEFISCSIRFRIHLSDPISLMSHSEIGSWPSYFRKYKMTGVVIGEGAFGQVQLVKNQGQNYAGKCMRIHLQKRKEAAVREYNLMKRLCHPRVCSVVEAFWDNSNMVIVMEYLWGGELFERVIEANHVKEVDIITFVRQICEGLRYIHGQDILHLDIKPENVVCISPNSNTIKIIDFGLAKPLIDGMPIRVIYGTRDYIAPECLNFEELQPSCDMWSLGVLTYVLLTGKNPFYGDQWPERMNNILEARYTYDDVAIWEVSRVARDFVNRLLVLDTHTRLTADEALRHQWLVQGPPADQRATEMKISRQRLKDYVQRSRASRQWQVWPEHEPSDA